MNKSFYFQNLSPSGGGPHIFAKRLTDELISQGLTYSPDALNQLTLINGQKHPEKYNILRLDGLNFKKDDPENQSIFKSYKSFDHIIFQGEFCRSQYEASTGIEKDHSIIRNGVPDSFFENHSPAFESDLSKVLIASASWRRHKRIEEVIEAFKSPKLKDVMLVVLGGYSGPDLPNVCYFPKIKPEDLPNFYQSADAMVHLSWLDWCPNTVVEGLASGLPVLCSHNGGTKELVQDDGIVLKLEEDYKEGTYLDLYNPPKIDIEIIVNGVLKIVGMPKIKIREDLKISNVALKYREVFNV